MAKGKQELVFEDKKIKWKDLDNDIFYMLKNLQDESHRFAINYHKLLYKKYNFKD
jgi:excinuclease UvrABC nuclease subunit